MSRYITTDTRSGEIVHASNRHPLLQPLRPRKTPRTGLYLPKARMTSNQRELVYTVVLMVFAMLFWWYALGQ